MQFAKLFYILQEQVLVHIARIPAEKKGYSYLLSEVTYVHDRSVTRITEFVNFTDCEKVLERYDMSHAIEYREKAEHAYLNRTYVTIVERA